MNDPETFQLFGFKPKDCEGLPIRDAEQEIAAAAEAVKTAAVAVSETADAATVILKRVAGWLDRLEKLIP